MKFKRTLILFVVFLVLLAAVLLFESREEKTKEVREKKDKLVDLVSSDIAKVKLKKENEVITFEKNDKGEWLIIEPILAKADYYEVNSLVENFSNLKSEKIVEKEVSDPSVYEIPRIEIDLWTKKEESPVKIMIGMENPIDNSLYAKRADDTRVVLIASFLRSSLDKKLIDFRDKTIFKFETGEVKTIEVRSKSKPVWKASLDEKNWFFEKPFQALAKKTNIDSILSSLSNLRAREFLSEDKNPEDLKKHGLDKPEFEVTLFMPTLNKNVSFFFNKKDDILYAANSESNKIISTDTYVISDLEKKPEDLREKRLALFNSWEVEKFILKRRDLDLIAIKEKTKDLDRWLAGEKKQQLEKSKVDEFLRKIEYLEASEFIDQPQSLADYGLDNPWMELTIVTRDIDGKTEEVRILGGQEDREKKQLVVKNVRYDYLFRVDSSWLELMPEKLEDWLSPKIGGEPKAEKK